MSSWWWRIVLPVHAGTVIFECHACAFQFQINLIELLSILLTAFVSVSEVLLDAFTVSILDAHLFLLCFQAFPISLCLLDDSLLNPQSVEALSIFA